MEKYPITLTPIPSDDGTRRCYASVTMDIKCHYLDAEIFPDTGGNRRGYTEINKERKAAMETSARELFVHKLLGNEYDEMCDHINNSECRLELLKEINAMINKALFESCEGDDTSDCEKYARLVGKIQDKVLLVIQEAKVK